MQHFPVKSKGKVKEWNVVKLENTHDSLAALIM